MPRKKRVIIDSEIPDNAIDTSDGEQVMFGDDTPLDEVFDSFGEESFLMKVYKITPTGSSFVFSSTEKPNPAMFESTIQDRYPSGGKFVVRFYKNNRIIEPSRHVEIEPRPVTASATNGNESLYAMQVKMLSDQLMTMQNMVMAFIGRPAPVTQQTPVNELVTVMTAMQGIQGNRTDSVDMLLKGIELAKGLNGTATDWKSELVSTAKEVLVPVAGVIAQHKMQQGQANQPSNVQQIPERTDSNNGMKVPNFLIKQGLNWLKPKIMSGQFEPGLAVDLILASASDPTYQPFIQMAVQGDINTFIQIDPDLANEPYKSWFVAAIEMLKGAYANNIQGDSNRGVGDSADTTGNEVVSSGISSVPQAS